jgi:hypothetical protein|tara:strand:+ start:671 stop:802 length:132 start_codon:yes stop_codon:yes gene_type:complete
MGNYTGLMARWDVRMTLQDSFVTFLTLKRRVFVLIHAKDPQVA